MLDGSTIPGCLDLIEKIFCVVKSTCDQKGHLQPMDPHHERTTDGQIYLIDFQRIDKYLISKSQSFPHGSFGLLSTTCHQRKYVGKSARPYSGDYIVIPAKAMTDFISFFLVVNRSCLLFYCKRVP